MDPSAASGRIFVLGAGASVFAGYPLASDLLSFIRNFRPLEVVTKEIGSRVMDKLNQAEFFFKRNVIRDPNRILNLEELLTYLELYRSFPGTAFAINPWDDNDSSEVRRLVTEAFLDYQYDLSRLIWEANTPPSTFKDHARIKKISDSWATFVQPGDVMLTFNWDILHEVIFWKAGLWSYKDGYGFQCQNQGDAEETSKLKILKLHGSINWVQDNPSSPVREIADVGTFFTKSKGSEPRNHRSQAQQDSGRKLVLPTYLKDISSNKALLDIWTNAHWLISRATELIVVGYSLHPVDHPARLLFDTALSENKRLSRITVVSPVPTEWDRFLMQINKPMHRIPRKFEEWVCSDPNS